MSHDKKKPEDQQKKAEELELGRREFLTTLAVMGGGAIAYASPSLAAAGASATGASSAATLGKFNIALPARYKVEEPQVVINVVKSNGDSEAVALRASADIVLRPTTDPDIAAVHAEAFDLVGVNDSTTTAKVKGDTVIGQLNLKSGKFVENSFPLVISTKDGVTQAKVVPTLALVQESNTADKKCTKKNDVDIDLPSNPGTLLSASGTGLEFGLAPNGGIGTV